MALFDRRRISIIVTALAAVTITGVGLFYGSIMDQSWLPPSGGGWRCYVSCVLSVWMIVGILTLPVIIIKFSTWLWRRLFAELPN